MNRKTLWFGLALLLPACSTTEVKHGPASGVITTDSGGAVGYQHGMDRSKFAIGASRKYANEFGFVKVVGSEGTFAVDETNGLAVAIPNAHSTQGQIAAWYTHAPEQHNQLVMDYFAGAGIPKDQMGGVHATMSLLASADGRQSPAPQPKVGGYQSVVDRKIGDIAIVDSIAWARISDQGTVLAEWVYWPPIPGRAITDARRMQETLSTDSDKAAFLAKLPANLPPGNVVIRHSSAMVKGPLEAFASYDVIERRSEPESAAEQHPSDAGRAILVVRHFGADGNELRLPQEKRNAGADYPTAKRPPPPGAQTPR